jgi:hypothetical protein
MSISAKNVLPSVLMEAIRKGDMKFVRKLVDDGADVNHHDLRHGRPVIYAVKTRQLDTVRLLVEHGASLAGTLNLASRDDDLELARFLLSLGANADGDFGLPPNHVVPVVDRYPPLFECQSVPMARLLIEAGCDLDALDSRGYSVLHRIVARTNDEELLLFLCACGVDVNAHAAGGLSAQECCVERNMYFVLGAAGATLDLSPGQLRRLKLISKADVRHCVEYAAYELARAQVDLIREPSFQICLGLESIHLPAFVTCCILEFACEPFTNCVKFHHFWNIATKVKHHFQVKE